MCGRRVRCLVWLALVVASLLTLCGTSLGRESSVCPALGLHSLFQSRSVMENNSRPHIAIQVIPDEDLENKRVFVVGDVHGCYDVMVTLFRQADVLRQVSPRLVLKDDVIIVFVGDLVNKGPESERVLHFLRDTPGVYSILGNHEVYWITSGVGYGVTQGSRFTLSPTTQDIEFIKTLPHILRIPKYNALIVHAGLMPNTAPEDQSEFSLTLMRNVVQQGATWQPYSETDLGEHWASMWQGPEHVYFGHDARRGKDKEGRPRVQRFPLATGLDTRCVKGGNLTGVFLPVERNEFYSVHNPVRYDFS